MIAVVRFGGQPAPPDPTMRAMNSPDSHTFKVDLRGLVDLLSHHLYSSPRVYIRELLQNGVDAITARRHDDPDAPADVRITVSDSGLRITDSGVGLTADQMHELLATIGRSSKRDGLEETRKDFLGQFGIGLLACFVVASQITVVSRSAMPGAMPVKWVARDDGTYHVTELPVDAHPEPGTTVEVSPRPAQRAWVTPERVKELAAEFGSLLPFSVTVDGDEITQRPPVWERDHPTQTARRIALNAYCEQALGFTPLDVIDLDLPEHGVRGPRSSCPMRPHRRSRSHTASTSKECYSPTPPPTCCPAGHFSPASSSTPPTYGRPPHARTYMRTRLSPWCRRPWVDVSETG